MAFRLPLAALGEAPAGSYRNIADVQASRLYITSRKSVAPLLEGGRRVSTETLGDALTKILRVKSITYDRCKHGI